jgi:hypothetical protein
MLIRLLAKLLIVSVLFTHSSMAMDVHLPHNTTQSSQPGIASYATSEEVASGLTACTDAGGHCSHHQAHTTGLFSVTPLSEMQTGLVLFPQFQDILIFHIDIPPRKPPKV